ncbi:hypothetical protein [Ascidiimonas aurantiaca]|uniref:hypothetical protein n=1 Tax=Ascidiimonas aurantiaca TaxID=1685432 RepID=UPI0030EE3B0C
MKDKVRNVSKDANKKSYIRRFTIDGVLIVLIGLSPFVAYFYDIINIPTDAPSWDFGLFVLNKGQFSSVYIALWIILGKLVPFYLFVLWFLTCKQWWYHIILVPIAMYAFQLFSAINRGSQFIDEVEIYWVIPILMIVAPTVYWIRIRLFDKLIYGIDLKEIERELDEYKQKEREERRRRDEERKKRLSDIH